MSMVTYDDIAKEGSQIDEDELQLDTKVSLSNVVISEDFSAKNLIESDHEKLKTDDELNPVNDLLNNEMEFLQSKDIQKVESKSGIALENISLNNDNGNNLNKSGVNHEAICSKEKQKDFIIPLDTEINNPQKLIVGKADIHPYIDDASLKGISKIDRNKVEINADNRESETHENQIAVANIYPGSFCAVNNSREICGISSSIKSCVDAILDHIYLTDKENELVNENNCDILGVSRHVISSQEKMQNFIKPLNMEINKSGKKGINTCCNSEKDNFFSKVVIIKKTTSIDNGRSGKKGIAEPDSQVHENWEVNANSGNYRFINGYKEVTEINDDVSCIDMLLKNLDLIEDKAKLTNGSYVVSSRKELQEINEKFCKVDKSIQKDQMKEDNCEALRVNYTISSNENQESFIKLKNTEINNSGTQDIFKCCNLEKNNLHPKDTCDVLKNISKDSEKADKMNEHKNSKDNVNSGDNCFINSYKEARGTKDDISCVDMIFENLSVAKKNELINDDFVSNRKKSEKINRELSKLGKSFTEDQIKDGDFDAFGVKHAISSEEKQENFIKVMNSNESEDIKEIKKDQAKLNSCDAFRANHGINADIHFSEPPDTEVKDSHAQRIDLYSNSDQDSFNSGIIDLNFKDILIKDYGKAHHINRSYDNTETQVDKQGIQDSICDDKNSVVDSNVRVGGTCDDITSNTLHENESEFINVAFNANDIKKPEDSSRQSKLGHQKNQMKENNCDVFEANRTINSDVNCSLPFHTKISHKSLDSYCNSEKENFNSDNIDISFEDLSTKQCGKAKHINTDTNNAETEAREQQDIQDGIFCNRNRVSNERTSDDIKSSHLEIADLSENETELINVDFIANNSERSKVVSQELSILCGNIQKHQTKKENNCVVFRVNHTSSSEESQIDFINALDIDTSSLCEQNTDVCNNPEKENFNSDTYTNSKSSSLKEQGRASQTNKSIDNVEYETLKHQNVKSTICNGSTSIPDVDSEIRVEIKPCTLKKKMPEITTLKSNITVAPEDSDVIIVYDNGNENFDYDILNENVNEFSDERKYLNNDVKSREKFYEELDNELEILKVQYSVIERKLVAASESFSVETVYDCIAKIKKELTSCVESIEKRKIRFKNKWLRTKSETSNIRARPSTSYQQYSEKSVESPVDEYRHISQACNRLHTISNTSRLYQQMESHFNEYNSQMPPQETSHKCKKSSDHFRNSEIDNLHKRKLKLSQYSFERSFQQFNSDKCCLPKTCTYTKETIGDRSARYAKYHAYSSKLSCYSKVSGFSKNFFPHKVVPPMFDTGTPRNKTSYSSHSNQTTKLSSLIENYSVSKPHCSRKKTSHEKNDKKFKLSKYGREYSVNSESSNSSEISMTSDRESIPVHSDDYCVHGKCYRRTSKYTNKSIKKDKTSSGKEKSRKRKYKRDAYSTCSSESPVQERKVPFEKIHHKKEIVCKWDTAKKRNHGIIDLQMDFVNKHVSRRNDLIKSPESYFIPSNIVEQCKRKKYLNEKKFSDNEISCSSSNDISPTHKNQKMRKKKAYEPIATPYKLAKLYNQTDVHNTLNKYNCASSNTKLRSSTPSSSCPILPEDTDRLTPYKQAVTRNCVDEKEDIYENKCNIQNCKTKLKSVVLPSPVSISAVETKRRKIEKESGYLSSKILRDPVKKHNEIKFNNFDNRRRGKVWNDTVQAGINDEAWSQNEINSVKDMQSYFSFLKKKKGNYTNAEILFKDPITTLTENVPHAELSFDTCRENKYRGGCIEKVGTKANLMQKSQTNLVYPENTSVKVKTKRIPKICLEVTERSVNERPVKKKSVRLPQMSSEVTEQSLIKKSPKKKSVSTSPMSWKKNKQSIVEKPALKDSMGMPPISLEVTKTSLIDKPAKKKPVCITQISSEMIEKSTTKKPAKKKSVEDGKDSLVFNRSLDLYKQLNMEISKKKVRKRTPVASKTSTSADDAHSKYQN